MTELRWSFGKGVVRCVVFHRVAPYFSVDFLVLRLDPPMPCQDSARWKSLLVLLPIRSVIRTNEPGECIAANCIVIDKDSTRLETFTRNILEFMDGRMAGAARAEGCEAVKA